jgi:hypothetical protein
MKSKARRRKLSSPACSVEIGDATCFVAWLASKLRLRRVFSDKKLTVAETTFENIAPNVGERTEFIRS